MASVLAWLDGSDATIDGFIGTGAGSDIEHGPSTAERTPDRRGNPSIRPTILRVSLADEPVVCVSGAAIVMSGNHDLSPRFSVRLSGTSCIAVQSTVILALFRSLDQQTAAPYVLPVTKMQDSVIVA